MPTILALDYGTKRIGLAISRARLAEPLTVINNTPSVYQQINEIVTTEAVDTIVIGLSEQQMAEKTKSFADQLATKVSPPIVFTDETLSTQAVRDKLKLRNKRINGPIDHYAAAEFLQEWLDAQSG